MTNRPPVHLSRTEVHPLTSRVTGERFELWLGHPIESWFSHDRPRHLLYLLDANPFFGRAVEMTRLMHVLFGELPPVVVAGIAYPDVDPGTQSRLRAGHFTPSPDHGFAEAARALAPPGAPAPEPPPMGGADDFLSFLRLQVDPFLREELGIGSAPSTLFGTSLGGLFAIHALRTAPEWVDHIIAGSPSLWWNQEEVFEGLRPGGDGVTRAGPDVVISVGAGEEGPAIPHLSRFRLVTNSRRMADLLADGALPCRSAHLEVVEGESHTSVVPTSLTRGLRRLLA